MTDNVLKSQAFKLKGRLYTVTVLQLLSCDYELIAQQLSDVIAQAPRLFYKTPIILDCSSLSEIVIDLASVCNCMREHHLVPIGVQGANESLATLAQSHGLAILNASAVHDREWLGETSRQDEAASLAAIRTKLLTTPVRSGQQVVSKGDLVITASVSHGAELLADGNIHVYGTLRGRALAGISGNAHARIFCQALEAELLSIAGFYCLSDAIGETNHSCQIYLLDEHIKIEAL